jgi:hypothetical protein
MCRVWVYWTWNRVAKAKADNPPPPPPSPLGQVATEKERVRCIDERVAAAKKRVDRFSSNTGKAIQVFASSTYPVTSSTSSGVGRGWGVGKCGLLSQCPVETAAVPCCAPTAPPPPTVRGPCAEVDDFVSVYENMLRQSLPPLYDAEVETVLPAVGVVLPAPHFTGFPRACLSPCPRAQGPPAHPVVWPPGYMVRLV